MAMAIATRRAFARAVAEETLREIRRIIGQSLNAVERPVPGPTNTVNNVLMGTLADARRFWSKVRVGEPNQCWPWLGGKSPGGYGVFTCERRSVQAHRYAYLFAHGTIAQAMHILHLCDNRLCCNAGHLRAGTPAENMRDRDTRRRVAHGERHHHAKLTEDLVRAIRASHESISALARRFGLTRRTIRLVRIRQSWKHIL